MAAFVDTNILIYALLAEENEAADKVNIARQLIADLSGRQELVLSTQVLGEFASNAIRKGNPPLTPDQTMTEIRELCTHTIISIDASLVQLALQRVQ